MWGIPKAIMAFFKSVAAVAGLVEKTIPSPDLQKQIYEDKKKKKEPEELMSDFRKARRFLSKPWNKGIDIDNHVEYAFGSFEAGDKAELKRMLHEALRR